MTNERDIVVAIKRGSILCSTSAGAGAGEAFADAGCNTHGAMGQARLSSFFPALSAGRATPDMRTLALGGDRLGGASGFLIVLAIKDLPTCPSDAEFSAPGSEDEPSQVERTRLR